MIQGGYNTTFSCAAGKFLKERFAYDQPKQKPVLEHPVVPSETQSQTWSSCIARPQLGLCPGMLYVDAEAMLLRLPLEACHADILCTIEHTAFWVVKVNQSAGSWSTACALRAGVFVPAQHQMPPVDCYNL